MAIKNKPGVILQPDTYLAFQRGIDLIVRAVQPTLGPVPRYVVNQPIGIDQPMEYLDQAGVIVRRLVQVEDRQADVGAMYLRHILFSVHEEVGDGVATTAVIFNSIFKQGIRFVTQGGNAMRLRVHLEKAMHLVLDEMTRLTQPVQGRQKLAALAKSVCYDPEMAGLLGEVMDVLGPYGYCEVSTHYSRELQRQYYNGANWPTISLNDRVTSDVGPLREDIIEPAILITDFEFTDAESLMPVIQMALVQDIRSLILIAASLSDEARGLLHVANQDPSKLSITAIKTPGSGVTEHTKAMVDMAVLTGGQPLVSAAGFSSAHIKPENLGHARLAWTNKSFIGFSGSKSDPMIIKRHIKNLEESYQHASDRDIRKTIRERLSKFVNGSAGLFVGGIHEADIERRKEVAKRTIDALHSAMDTGILPGAGAALLACQKVLLPPNTPRPKRDGCRVEPEEAAAYRILSDALEAPTRTILSNAGYTQSLVEKIKRAAPRACFDVISGKLVRQDEDTLATGISDVAGVQMAAVRAAITGAAMALTTDVIIQHRNPQESIKP